MKRKFLLLLTLIFGLVAGVQPAFAMDPPAFSMTINPTSQDIELFPGQEYTGKVNITNTGSASLNFTASAAPYMVDNETYEPSFSEANDFTQLYNWITFPQEIYHLEPGQSASVEFKVNVPAEATGGGQYAAIIASSNDTIQEGAAIKVISQVAGILYGRVNGAEMHPEGELVEQSAPFFTLGGPIEISERTYNTGNVDFKVHHAATITNFFTGEELFNATTKDNNGGIIGSTDTIVLPGTARTNIITWEDTPPIGIFKVKQKIIFLEEDVESEFIVVICPVWFIIGVIVLILLLVLWMILAAKRRKRKQPQVF